jgi:hypothetical protein
MSYTVPPARRVLSRVGALALAAAILAMAVPAAASAAPASRLAAAQPPRAAAAAVPDTLPPSNATLLSHVCAEMGSDGTTEAVHCVDLYSDGGADYTAANEFECENISTRQAERCADIKESVEVAIHTNEPKFSDPTIFAPRSGECGVSIGHSACVAPRTESAFEQDYGDIATRCTMWAVTGDTAAGGLADQVRLPGSGQWVSHGALATAHVTADCLS